MNSRRQNSLTQYCDAVRWRILNFYAQAASNGKPPTSQQIIEYVKNNYTERQYMLYELLDNFLRIERGRVGYEISKSTFYKHTLVTARLKEAIADKPLREVCHADILNFKHYLRNSVGLSHNTLCGYLTKAKSIFSYALDNNLISSNPFRQIRMQREEVEIHPLTKQELERIRLHDFGSARLNHVRDCFVFASNTAMAYSDMASITPDDIREQDGVYFIRKCRVKTGVKYVVPLNDTALEILQRYEYYLPLISNQKYNAYLKEIARICGIRTRISSHTARHTAATLMLNSGISMDIVSKILGHTNTTMTAHYAKMMDDTILRTKIEF